MIITTVHLTAGIVEIKKKLDKFLWLVYNVICTLTHRGVEQPGSSFGS